MPQLRLFQRHARPDRQLRAQPAGRQDNRNDGVDGVGRRVRRRGCDEDLARRDGDVYRINGQKMLASIANETDVGVLFAKTDRDAGARGISGFIVEPKKYPGWKAQPIDMLGLSNAFRTNVLFLDDLVVPVENRLGAEGDGFKIVMRALEAGRVTVAGKALGIARGCFEDAVRYAKEGRCVDNRAAASR
jgi:alkylation response protein AidB-like acyl-CoA dehydrogenase